MSVESLSARTLGRWKSATGFGNFAVPASSCFDFVVSILRSSGQFTNTYESGDLRATVPWAKAVTQTSATRPDNPPAGQEVTESGQLPAETKRKQV